MTLRISSLLVTYSQLGTTAYSTMLGTSNSDLMLIHNHSESGRNSTLVIFYQFQSLH